MRLWALWLEILISFLTDREEKHEQIFWLTYLKHISDGKFVFIKADPFSQEMAEGT
jgi:hypothetical protein